MLGYKETTPSRACWSSSVRGFFSLPSISPTQNRVYPINNRGAAENVGWAILATAALGFIGVGAQPPHPEWGLMISEGRDYLISNWYLSTLPGTAMFLVVLSLILFGDGLRDSLDPTLRHQ